MLTLSKSFGGLVNAVQLSVITGFSFYAINFLNSWIVVIFFAVLLCGVALGSTQFFDKILAFTPSERTVWVSFVGLPASIVLWGSYRMFSSVAERLSTLGSADIGNASLLSTFASQSSMWPTPLLFQIGLLSGAYLALAPSIKDGSLTRALLVLPLALALLGAFIGLWVMGHIANV